jgi:ribosomal-protein-alanine N-acetyltransferase
MQVRAACEEDLDFVLRLQDSSPEAPHWSAEQYRGMLGDGGAGLRRVLLVAEVDGVPVGYAAGSVLLEEAELEAIVVSEERRRGGIGRRLTKAVEDWAVVQGARELRLEVRVSNDAAGAMYHAMGFQQTGMRSRYYSDPEEDAVLMTMRLG